VQTVTLVTAPYGDISASLELHHIAFALLLAFM